MPGLDRAHHRWVASPTPREGRRLEICKMHELGHAHGLRREREETPVEGSPRRRERDQLLAILPQLIHFQGEILNRGSGTCVMGPP